MLLFQGASPFERAFDRDLAELLEVPATGVDTGRLETEKVLEIFLMPRVLLRFERMHGADLARTERLVGPLLRAGAARYPDSDVVLQLLEKVVERKSAREVDRQPAKQDEVGASGRKGVRSLDADIEALLHVVGAAVAERQRDHHQRHAVRHDLVPIDRKYLGRHGSHGVADTRAVAVHHRRSPVGRVMARATLWQRSRFRVGYRAHWPGRQALLMFRRPVWRPRSNRGTNTMSSRRTSIPAVAGAIVCATTLGLLASNTAMAQSPNAAYAGK